MMVKDRPIHYSPLLVLLQAMLFIFLCFDDKCIWHFNFKSLICHFRCSSPPSTRIFTAVKQLDQVQPIMYVQCMEFIMIRRTKLINELINIVWSLSPVSGRWDYNFQNYQNYFCLQGRGWTNFKCKITRGGGGTDIICIEILIRFFDIFQVHVQHDILIFNPI